MSVRGEGRRVAGGFVMLESVVAMSLLGTMLAAIFALWHLSLYQRAEQEAWVEALLLAQGRVEALRSSSEPLLSGEEEWQGGEAVYTARWQSMPYAAGLTRVRLEVSWKEKPGTGFTLETLLWRPEE